MYDITVSNGQWNVNSRIHVYFCILCETNHTKSVSGTCRFEQI